MSEQKKIVDLIILDPPENEKELITQFRSKIQFWLEELETSSTSYLDQNFDTGSTGSIEFMEVVNMKQFITHFIEKRLDWIISSVNDPKLRRQYLTLLPPFPHQAGVKRLLLHFFQTDETSNKKGIKIALKSDAEKESTILWDVYKLLKTVETANTILKNLDSQTPFPSIFPLEYRKQCIASTKAAASIMFRKFIRPEKQPLFVQGMPRTIFSPEAILERRGNNDLLIAADMMEGLNYRNFFFSFFYFPTVRAMIDGKKQEISFNYLDFELIKQEFLCDWMNQRLKNHPSKFEVYEKYMIADQSLARLVEKHPENEIEYLQQLPLEHFNDIMAQVNTKVEQSLKTKVDPLSENFGEHSFFYKQFKRALRFTKSPLTKLKQLLRSHKGSVDEFDDEFYDDMGDMDDLCDSLEEELMRYEQFEYFRLKKNEIDFPFFQNSAAQFSRKLKQLRTTMDPARYTDFSQEVKKVFSQINHTALIKRRTPKHEWVLPHLIKDLSFDEPVYHLLLLGAEVKSSQLGTSYSTGALQEDAHQFTCYFVYATSNKNNTLGTPIATRHARGIELYEYDCANVAVQELIVSLMQQLLQQL